jgi:hypothetical protein
VDKTDHTLLSWSFQERWGKGDNYSTNSFQKSRTTFVLSAGKERLRTRGSEIVSGEASVVWEAKTGVHGEETFRLRGQG